MVSPSERAQDRKEAINALRSEGFFQGIWIFTIANLVMESHQPKTLAVALMVLKKYASSDWGSVARGSVEEKQLLLMINFLIKHDDPLLPIMAMIILNRFPRFNFELALLSADEVLAPWKVYLSLDEGMISYSVLSPSAEIIMSQKTNIPAPEPFTLENLKVYQNQIFREMSRNKHLCRHDKEWSVLLLNLILQSAHPLPFAVLIAKLGELSAWHRSEAIELLLQVYNFYPVWIVETGFLNAFINLSLEDFQELDFRIETLPTFASRVLELQARRASSCPNDSFIRELCLYLGISLGKANYRELYPDASANFFAAIQLNPHEFLEVEDVANSMSARR